MIVFAHPDTQLHLLEPESFKKQSKNTSVGGTYLWYVENYKELAGAADFRGLEWGGKAKPFLRKPWFG